MVIGVDGVLWLWLLAPTRSLIYVPPLYKGREFSIDVQRTPEATTFLEIRKKDYVQNVELFSTVAPLYTLTVYKHKLPSSMPALDPTRCVILKSTIFTCIKAVQAYRCCSRRMFIKRGDCIKTCKALTCRDIEDRDDGRSMYK